MRTLFAKISGLICATLCLLALGAFDPTFNGPARAETISDICMKTWTDNASYKNCVTRLTEKQSKQLKSKACSGTACIYRLKATKARDEYGNAYQYRGSGYSITYSYIDSGRAIELADPSGALTHLSQCGTCSGLDYEDGPARDVEIGFDGKDIVLTIPK